MYLFKKPKNDPSVAIASSHAEKVQVAKLLLSFIALMNMVDKSLAVCFESKTGNDYTLKCDQDEDTIFNKILKNCDAYQTGGDDCADFFTESLDFCKGVFGDAVCTLTYHAGVTPGDCIVEQVQDNCSNGVITVFDGFMFLFMGIGISFLAMTIAVCHKCCKKSEPNEDIPLLPARKQLGV